MITDTRKNFQQATTYNAHLFNLLFAKEENTSMSKQVNANNAVKIVKIASSILSIALLVRSHFSYVIPILVLTPVYLDFMEIIIQENVFNVLSLA